jgi:hypothetical protein
MERLCEKAALPPKPLDVRYVFLLALHGAVAEGLHDEHGRVAE